MGETRSAAEIAAGHHDALLRWARALSRFDPEEAMEIVQQTYLEVIEGRADLLRADDPRAFLFGVARRVAASRRRRRSIWGRILRLQLSNEPARPAPADPERAACAVEMAARLKEALRSLPPRQIQAVSLVFAEGLTVEESARVMGVSLGSARTHYHRGKLRLARLLEDISDEPHS
jgi:RNA polymerase sigma-70 factor (ECF subfamily)